MITVTLLAAISLCGRTLKNKMHSHTEGFFRHRYPGAVAKEEMRMWYGQSPRKTRSQPPNRTSDKARLARR